jgi:hypothetical protein
LTAAVMTVVMVSRAAPLTLLIGLECLLLLRREYARDLALDLRLAQALTIRVGQDRPDLGPLL